LYLCSYNLDGSVTRWVSKESALLVSFSPGFGLSSHSVLQRQTSRQFSTTVGRGSYTCLALFSSPTERATLHRGCGSTASQTRTRWVTTAGALRCWLSFTVSFARRAGDLHRQPHLVGVCTYSSCGCGHGCQLLIPWCWLLMTGSQCITHVYSRRGCTCGTR
jgi:hypothetical protein